MNDIKIIDNFLPENEFKILNDNLTDPLFPWYINQVINDDYNHKLLADPIDNYQFCHHFYYPVSDGGSPNVCQGINCLDPIIKRLDCISLARIKANCLPRTSSIIRHGFHIDAITASPKKDFKVSIFYVNTNNGYTEFEDGTRIESISNRLVTFPIHLRHTGTTCTNQSVRIVINFNYF
tara:strand:+ start:113 stop:649 length:537 start_codon:yes stop_codon:yes gene_type:complete